MKIVDTSFKLNHFLGLDGNLELDGNINVNIFIIIKYYFIGKSDYVGDHIKPKLPKMSDV